MAACETGADCLGSAGSWWGAWLGTVLMTGGCLAAAVWLAMERAKRDGQGQTLPVGQHGLPWLTEVLDRFGSQLRGRAGLSQKLLAAWTEGVPARAFVGVELRMAKNKAAKVMAHWPAKDRRSVDFWKISEGLGLGPTSIEGLMDLTPWLSVAALMDMDLDYAAKSPDDANPDYDTMAGVGPTKELLPNDAIPKQEYAAVLLSRNRP